MGGRRRRVVRPPVHPLAVVLLVLGGLLVLAAACSIGWGWWMRHGRPGQSVSTPASNPPPITVEVLNGEPGGGSAGEIAADLREAGFTVVRTGRADRRDYRGLLVVARGELADARVRAARVAASLGTPRVIVQRREHADTDVTVIVGAPATR